MCILEYAAIISIRNESLILQCVPRFIPFLARFMCVRICETQKLHVIPTEIKKIMEKCNNFFIICIRFFQLTSSIAQYICFRSIFLSIDIYERMSTYLEPFRMRRYR